MLLKFKRINDLRIDNDLTIKEMAKIIGVSVDNFFDYANGRSNFPLDKLNKFVNYFKTSFDYVTGLSNVKMNYQNKINLKLLQKRLKEVRLQSHYSQAMAANIIGDKQSTYWNYENGVSVIPISKLYLLAAFYNVSIDYFVGKTNNKNIIKKQKKKLTN